MLIAEPVLGKVFKSLAVLDSGFWCCQHPVGLHSLALGSLLKVAARWMHAACAGTSLGELIAQAYGNEQHPSHGVGARGLSCLHCCVLV
jgi:hypothetical protein